MKKGPDDLAKAVMETVPPLMRSMRTEMRKASKGSLTIPQFRVLNQLSQVPQSNQTLAEWMGVTAPTMSRMISSLVQRKLVERKPSPEDQRNVNLSCTKKGMDLTLSIRRAVQKELAQRISALPSGRMRDLELGLQVMRELIK